MIIGETPAEMPAPMPERPLVFPRQERLKGRDEIREVFNGKRSVSCGDARLFYRKNGLTHNRIAFTFSRKFGNAVERNRAKRLGREAYRRLRHEIKPGHDLVLLVYPGNDDFQSRFTRFRDLLARAGLSDRTKK